MTTTPTRYLSVKERYLHSLCLTVNKDGSFDLVATDGEVLAEALNLNFALYGSEYGTLLGLAPDHFAFRHRARRALNSFCAYWRVKYLRTRYNLRRALA